MHRFQTRHKSQSVAKECYPPSKPKWYKKREVEQTDEQGKRIPSSFSYNCYLPQDTNHCESVEHEYRPGLDGSVHALDHNRENCHRDC